MSGHSHYATIHRQKELNDAARGNVFSKLARAITIAVKAGGGPDPNANFKLRVEMDRAHAANMPKDNIERAIARAAESGEALEEVSYEGFGPSGVAVIVKAATDNRNRTGQEIKNLFERAGGSLAGPGAVSFNFGNKGFFLVEKKDNPETQMLTLIDLGAQEVEETEDGIEVYVAPEATSLARKKIADAGFNIKETELIMKPKTLQIVEDSAQASKVLSFLDSLEDNEDVQKVYTNLDIPEAALGANV